MGFEYDYPRPLVTADILISRFNNCQIQILLIQRNHPPFSGQWALPGGFMEMNETLSETACRELQEETGFAGLPLFPLLMADNLKRDPRGRTITHVYGGITRLSLPEMNAGDEVRKIGWFSRTGLPSLAFDHQDIILRSWQSLMEAAFWKLYYLAFLNQHFPLPRSQHLCEGLFGDSSRATLLNTVAERLNIIRPVGADQFIRTVSDQDLYSIDQQHLTDTWFSMMK